MNDRAPGGFLVVVAAAFIVIAGGHGIGFLWMMFYRPLGVPLLTLPAAAGTAGILVSAVK